jgi:hypothetical protein
MTVLWVRTKPGCSETRGPTGEITFHKEYIVKSSVPDESRDEILECGAVPVVGGPHPSDHGCTCTRVVATQEEQHPYLWRVVADWSSVQPRGRLVSDDQQIPSDRRQKWRYRFIAFPQSLRCDLDGKIFGDSAGTPFDPPPEMAIYACEFTIERYEAPGGWSSDYQYIHAANSDAWNGAAAGTALIDSIDCVEIRENNAWWHVKTYTIVCCPKIQIGKCANGDAAYIGGFDYEYHLDAGPKELVADADGTKKLRVIADGNYADGRHQLLDGHGKRIPRNSDGSLSSAAVYLKFRTKKTVAFSGLDLVPPSVTS